MLTRRGFLACSTLAAASAWTAAASGEGADIEVKVAQGVLRGSVADGIAVYRGVPFAQPPKGVLRFRAPQPPTPWVGVREAKNFASASMQPNEPKLAQDEDCLYLNVWAPQRSGKSALPVLVWIHGGGFTGGHSFDALSDGTRFASAGIVCITIAYRLGALGFLEVSPLLGADYAGSADNALRDVMAALAWVQENVHAFGGDPRRVTIGGESAGAKLADILMGVPAAMPLFHQVISESGGAERLWPASQSKAIGEGFGKVWVEQTSLPVADLRTAPAEKIVAAQGALMQSWPAHFPLRPSLNPQLLARLPVAEIRAGSTRGKRLLVGTNLDESALFLGPHPRNAPGAKDLGNVPLEQFDKIAAGYKTLYPDMPEDLRHLRSVTAEEYWVPSLRAADAHVAGGGEAFVYRLDFPGTGRYAGLAFHSYDLRFVWNYFGGDTPSPAARALAQTMHAAWVSFIQGDAPKAADLPAWPAYDASKRPTMIFDQPCRVAFNPGGAELALWDGTLTG